MTQSDRPLRLISWNVNGLRAVMKKDFEQSVTLLDPDILMIQETKLQADQRTDDMINFPGYESFWAYASVKKGYSGVACYSRVAPVEVRTRLGNDRFDDEGRIIQMDFGDTVVFNVYFPNGTSGDERLQYKMDFYQWFFDYAGGVRDRGKSLIITGDFNTAHNEIDLKNPGPNSNRSGFLRMERDVLDGIVRDGYVDTFRHLHPDAATYSWWSYRFNARKNNAGWRIDYFFVTRDLVDSNRIRAAFIENGIMGSDHCPVGLEMIL